MQDTCRNSEPSSGGERLGIFGTETEYAVLYIPDDPSEIRIPSFETIERLLFEFLLMDRKAAVSSGLKGGYFLENGGLIHLEIFLRKQSDTPILEASTPECRSPHDLLVYQRAFDRILTEVSERTRKPLRELGFAGRISFGKNNRDVRGVGYGTHENYLVHKKTRLADKLLFLSCAPLILLLLLPAALFVLGILLAVVLGSTLSHAFPRSANAVGRITKKRFPHAMEELRANYFLLMSALILLPVFLYSLVLRGTAMRPFLKDLTAFLVTRQILTGSGGLDLSRGFFEISQRPPLTTSLAQIILYGGHKTIYDLKGLLYNPFSFFRSQRKLTITVGDSNLSEVSAFLSIGTTALVIEMVEAGMALDDLRLRHPLRALREVSTGGPWKELSVKGRGDPDRPGRRTAVEIQREYLRRARDYFAGKPEGKVRHQEILALWEEVLTQLAEAPGKLADRLDWAAKKSLLDAAVLAEGTWRNFFAWGRILSRVPRGLPASCRSLEELIGATGFLKRFRLRRLVQRAVKQGDIDPDRFESARDLFYQAQKIDLRYHEIGQEPGYERQLEAQGLIRRLTTDQEIARAAREPPPDTRARIRGYYISLSQSPASVNANWTSIELVGTSRLIPLPDPFRFQIPTDPSS